MRVLTPALCIVASVVVAANCDQAPTGGTTEFVMSPDRAGHSSPVLPVPAPKISTRDLAKELSERGEDPGVVRERLIKEIAERHPELADDETFRDPTAGQIFGLPPKYADVAELIAQVYQLLDIELGLHPERFIKTDEPEKLKRYPPN